MKHLILIAVAGAAFCALAFPTVSSDSVSLTKTAGRAVEIAYTLAGEAAVVTVDIQTNCGDSVWHSIGGRQQTRLVGDVNRLVKTTGAKRILWFPPADWEAPPAEEMRAVVSAWPANDPPDWMIVSLVVSSNVHYYASQDFIPEEGGVTNVIFKTDKLALRKIPAAYVRWNGGHPAGDSMVSGYDGNGGGRVNPHQVILTNDYYMSVFPLTRQQERNATGGLNFGLNAEHPEWTPTTTSDTKEYCLVHGKLTLPETGKSYNALRGTTTTSWAGWPQKGHEVLSTSYIAYYRRLTGIEFDLPTGYEWEYACRAGTETAFNNGTNGSDGLSEVGWWYSNSGGERHVVGLKKPNAWDIYDMHGNTRQWCLDWYRPTANGEVLVAPVGSDADINGLGRVWRSGNYGDWYQLHCSGMNYSEPPNYQYGYRLVAPCVAR